MSDFVSNAWAMAVSIAVLVSIIACIVLLWVSGTTKVKSDGDNTTGHVWDGDLQEMNNPLPRWWVGLFIITVLFAFLYAALYPTLGHFNGKLGWSSQGQHADQVASFEERIAPVYAKYKGMPAEEMAKDAKAMGIGERLFMNNCAQCHGSDARGSKSFPNLTDKDWLGGNGDTDYITEVIVNGRTGMMPPMGAAVGGAQDIENLAQYVLSLSGSPHDSVSAAIGKSKYVSCAACHGMDGKGNTAVGAPNLTDDIWLHGWGSEHISNMILNGKVNVMPPQGANLTEGQIEVLAAYVWSLSH